MMTDSRLSLRTLSVAAAIITVIATSIFAFPSAWSAVDLVFSAIQDIAGIDDKEIRGSENLSPAAAFTPGNLVIYRVGSGASALDATAAPVFLDEYTTAGTLVQSIAMPTSVSGSNKRLTAAGNGLTEGLLTRSVDGQYLVLAGFDAAPLATPTPSSVNRVVARVDANGTVDTSTALTDAAGNPRSVASVDGSGFWMTTSVTTAGVRYVSLGATTSTPVAVAATNLRGLTIEGGQLYVSSGGVGDFRMAKVGTGLPTTSGHNFLPLPGFPTSGLMANAFVLVDLSPSVPGADTVYVTDEGTERIKKFSLVSGSWTANGEVVANDARGLTATVSGTTATLFSTTGGSAGGGSLYRFVDSTGYNSAISGTATTIATAATNTAFRGIALAPVQPPPPASPEIGVTPASMSFGSQPVGSTSGTRSVTISNTGTGDLNIGQLEKGGVNGGEFTITADPSNTVIAAGGSAKIRVTFSPTGEPGSRSAEISIPSNDSDEASVVVALSGTAEAATTSAPVKSMWVWTPSPNPVTDPIARTDLIQRATAAGITDLYVSVRDGGTINAQGWSMYPTADVAALAAAAHAASMKIWYASGDPAWQGQACAPGNSAYTRMQEVVAYNNFVEANERFDGVMVDVEPGAAFDVALYAGIHECYRSILPTEVRLGTAINAFWEDAVEYPVGGETKPEFAHIIDLPFDQIVIMGYRDNAGAVGGNGIIGLDEDEIGYASSIGKAGLVLAGLETKDIAPGEPENVTFFEEGDGVLASESAVVASHFASSIGFGGFSIHAYGDEYLSGLSGWPSLPPAPMIEFGSAAYFEDESQTMTVTVTRSGDLNAESTVAYSMTAGSATGGADCSGSADYATLSGTLTFNPNEASKPLPGGIEICSDTFTDPEETFTITLSSPTNAELGPISSATATIRDSASQHRFETAIEPGSGANYPATINVASGPTNVGSVKVTLYDVVYPGDAADLDVLLVGPGGQMFILMADAASGNPINSPTTLTFSDQAGQVLPELGPMNSGTYEPTSYGASAEADFAAPAPSGPYNEPGSTVGGTPSLSSVFGGMSALGDWQLYLRVDGGAGFTQTSGVLPVINGGWGLQLLAPTASAVSVSGRIVDASGRSVRGATVSVQGIDGSMRSVMTNTFGYYRLDGLAAGESFVVTASARRYVFATPSLFINLQDDLAGVDFVAIR